MDNKLNKATEILKKYDQTHVIPFLENGANVKLIEQVLTIDFDKLKRLYNKTNSNNNVKIKELKPVAAVNPNKLTQEEFEKIENIGIEIIKNNKYAVCTMAGRTRNKTSDTLGQREHIG